MISGHREIEQGVRSLTLQAESTLDAEFVRALHTCDAAGSLQGPLTFHPGTALPEMEWLVAWQSWLDNFFKETVAPALLSVAAHAHAGRFREIAACDHALTSKITDFDISTRSRAAGNNMLKRLSGARGVRWLDRLQTAVEAGTTPGHFAAIYGCQAALFHLSPRLMLATYAYWEWCAAAVACRQPRQNSIAKFQTASAPQLQRMTETMLSSLAGRIDEPRRVLS